MGPRDGLERGDAGADGGGRLRAGLRRGAEGRRGDVVRAGGQDPAAGGRGGGAGALGRPPPAGWSALVPNEGLEGALAAGVGKVAVFTAATETFNKKNVNAGVAESIERFEPVVTRAHAAKVLVRGYVSTAFFCPYEGKTPPQRAVDVCLRLWDLGCDEIDVGDTIGAATPPDVAAVLDLLLRKLPADRVVLHFHDTRGTALTNVLTGLQYGVSAFDASAAGIGGCPYAPGASGNLATEDLVYLLTGLGIEHGVDLERLRAAARPLEPLLGRQLPGKVFRAGRSRGGRGDRARLRQGEHHALAPASERSARGASRSSEKSAESAQATRSRPGQSASKAPSAPPVETS